MPTPAESLTVAIPFYKGHGYLRSAIQSVLRQTDPHWELVVCDDGPEPGTAEVVHAFADPRIRYARNERNLGMAGNWNRCLDLARTDLVNLLHNDDELLPDYVARMRQAGAAFPQAAALFCRAKVIDAAGRDAFSVVDRIKGFLQPAANGPLVLLGPSAIEALARGNFIMCPTVCYRRSRMGAERFNAAWRFVLDLEFFTRLLAAGATLVGLPDVAFAYRRHADNATEQYTESLLRFEEECRLLDALAVTARDRGWTDVARVAAGKRVVRWHLLYRIARDLGGLRGAAASRKWHFFRRLVATPAVR